METRYRSMTERMKGAALLQVDVYEEVEHDGTATSQAAGVVAIVAVCAAVGGIGTGAGGILTGLLGAFVGWLVWSGITYLIGTNLFDGVATWGELLRTLGFAQSPGVLYVLGIIPLVGGLARLVLWIWLLATGLVAIRQALDVSTAKAVMTALLGWLSYVVIGLLLAFLFGLPTLGS